MVDSSDIQFLLIRINEISNLVNAQQVQIEKLERKSTPASPCPDPFNISPKLESALKNAGVKIDRDYIGNEIDRVEISFGKPESEMQYGEALEKTLDEINDKHTCELIRKNDEILKQIREMNKKINEWLF